MLAVQCKILAEGGRGWEGWGGWEGCGGLAVAILYSRPSSWFTGILFCLLCLLSCCRGKGGGANVGLIRGRWHEAGVGLIFLIDPIFSAEEISINSLFISFIFSLGKEKEVFCGANVGLVGGAGRRKAEGWGLAWPGLAWPGHYNLLCVRCSLCAGHHSNALRTLTLVVSKAEKGLLAGK